MHLKFGSGFHASHDQGSTRFEGLDNARKNIAGAQSVRPFLGKQNVPGANGDLDMQAGFSGAERDFKLASLGAFKGHAHDAIGWPLFRDTPSQQILESGGLRECDGVRGI